MPETLRHIAKQNIPPYLSCELILVNNNSTDNTEQIAASIWKKYVRNIPFKIVNETKPGLNYARFKGAEAAKYSILIFCDDDNWLEENYISYAYEIMTGNEKIAILGGRSTAFFNADMPFWFDDFQQAYAVGAPMAASGIANEKRMLGGAGMVVRRSLFELLSNFLFQPLLTDRRGTTLSSGGDYELCLLAMYLGYDLYYDDRLMFIHFMPANRLSWPYCVSMIKAHAGFQVYFTLYNHCYQCLKQEKKMDFDYAFRQFWFKHVKSVLRDCRGVKKIAYAIKCLLISQPGSVKEIDIKKKISKIAYAIKYKKTIKKDFQAMCIFMQRIKGENMKTLAISSLRKIS